MYIYYIYVIICICHYVYIYIYIYIPRKNTCKTKVHNYNFLVQLNAADHKNLLLLHMEFSLRVRHVLSIEYDLL